MIEAEAVLTGMINSYDDEHRCDSTSSVDSSPMARVGVAQDVLGPIHQHFVSYRLDFDIDGEKNSVIEMNAAMLPPNGERTSDEWFATETTVLKRELEAMRDLDMESGRWWKIINPGTVNSLNQHPGYAMMPGHNAAPYAGPHSAVRRRFGFCLKKPTGIRANPTRRAGIIGQSSGRGRCVIPRVY
jgi:primary-amine oxidase